MARPVGAAELLPLIRTLSDGRWHAGPRLAQTAGLTRAGLAKRIRRLADLGLEVETRVGRGYRLPRPLDLLEPDLITGHLPPGLRGRIPVRAEFSTDSTNRQLLDGTDREDPQALLAEHQSAGRGRMGRRWHSPFGANLYLSLSWCFPHWPETLTALPLATGAATAAALDACGISDLRLKWPNDILLGGHKLGGILVEQRGEAAGGCRVVIGLGLNVSMRAGTAAAIDQRWTSLADHVDPPPSRNLLAARVLENWVDMLDRFATEGFSPFAAAWRRLDGTYRKSVTVSMGERVITGTAQGVDDTGALRLDADGTRHRILSGDVSLRPARGGGGG